MTTTDIVTPAPEVPRDRYDRPLVVPPTGGKAIAYTRATTFADCIEDKFNLQQWERRMVAIGLTLRPDLLLAVSAHKDDKSKLNKICDAAKEAAEGSAAATTGTALHALTEQYDRGTLDITRVPAAYRADIEAYAEATRGVQHLHIEQFVVHDGLKIGGTPDRIVAYSGNNHIYDLKTGQVEFGQLKIAMQLAIYSRCVFYDPSTHERAPLPGIDRDRGIIVHVPAGGGTARLLWCDIATGWEAVQVARAVRDWRKRKGLLEEMVVASAESPLLHEIPADEPSLLELIAHAPTEGQLTALWRSHAHEWSDVHTQAAVVRKEQILAGAA